MTGAGRIDLRVSTIPTLHGEDMAIRLLVGTPQVTVLDQLGMSPREFNDLAAMIDLPSGLILVSGPTGSGKTTTLYACLRHLNNGERKINTIEDPIEYAIPGLRQSQINPKADVGFAELLRSVLRQAPDVILIGEIRDATTAEIAVRAANSGHLVLASVHAPSAPGAVQSMLSLGVHPHFLSSSLQGVIAQRLVRTLCTRCKAAFELGEMPGTFEEVRAWLEPGQGQSLHGARGCPECLQTGYSGRTGVFEVLEDHPRAPPADRRRAADGGTPRRGRPGRAAGPPPRRPAQGRPRPDQRRGNPPRHPARGAGTRRLDGSTLRGEEPMSRAESAPTMAYSKSFIVICGSAADPRFPGSRAHHRLYGRNLPDMVILTRSPFGSSSFSTSMVKSMALMMPSPNVSWMTSLSGMP